jgi:hypothetical protein
MDLFKPSFLEDPWASLEQAFHNLNYVTSSTISSEAEEPSPSTGDTRRNLDNMRTEGFNHDERVVQSSSSLSVSAAASSTSGAMLELDIDDII